MLAAFDGLGQSRMAIVQARQCHATFTNRARRLGIPVKKSPWVKWNQ